MAAARPLPTLFKLTVLQRECNHARTSDPFVVSTPAAERSSAPSHRVTTRAIASDCSFPLLACQFYQLCASPCPTTSSWQTWMRALYSRRALIMVGKPLSRARNPSHSC